MVRGLGARAGEVEVNTLLLPRWTRGALALDWAPEIEWAPRDNLALEIELPMHGGQLHALKTAIQGTLARRSRRSIAGWQVLAELIPGDSTLRTTALHLAGRRLSRRWSLLVMSGVRMDWTLRPAGLALALLLNPSVFADLSERVTLGFEHNLAVGLGGPVDGDRIAAVSLPARPPPAPAVRPRGPAARPQPRGPRRTAPGPRALKGHPGRRCARLRASALSLCFLAAPVHTRRAAVFPCVHAFFAPIGA
jgi:hypothetical protein